MTSYLGRKTTLSKKKLHKLSLKYSASFSLSYHSLSLSFSLVPDDKKELKEKRDEMRGEVSERDGYNSELRS